MYAPIHVQDTTLREAGHPRIHFPCYIFPLEVLHNRIPRAFRSMNRNGDRKRSIRDTAEGGVKKWP